MTDAISRTCPHCGGRIDPAGTPPARTNTPETVRVDVPAGALPGVVHALSIGRNTALMSREATLGEMLDELRRALAAQVPEAARAFPPALWAEMCTRAVGGARLDINVARADRLSRARWEIRVQDSSGTPWARASGACDTARSDVFEDVAQAQGAADALVAFLEALAPMS